MKKNPAFAERLRRAEHNIANRKRRRGAATAAPTKAFTDASPYHQRLAQFEAWRAGDPYLPPAVVNANPCGEENNRQLVRDLYEVRGDLIGKKVLSLLRGVEETHQSEGSETVNVFDSAAQSDVASLGHGSSVQDHHSTALVTLHSESDDSSVVQPGLLLEDAKAGEPESKTETAESAVGQGLTVATTSLQTSSATSVTEDTASALAAVSVDERSLEEYEAKLHRYSSKVRMEITERLRKPPGTMHGLSIIFPDSNVNTVMCLLCRCGEGGGAVPLGGDGRIRAVAREGGAQQYGKHVQQLGGTVHAVRSAASVHGPLWDESGIQCGPGYTQWWQWRRGRVVGR